MSIVQSPLSVLGDEAILLSTMNAVKFEEVAAEIRRAIADGEAKAGERLPPSKDLAAVLGVNTNTVLRALRQLRDEGLLEFRRGRGITVAGSVERGSVITEARALVRFARRNGYTTDELVAMIRQIA
jgi:GntR family transcriptional regulator